MTSDDRRIYSDEEFALILRKAAELANRSEGPDAATAGLTLTEIKSAALQVGIDPTLVERAARMLAATADASPLERVIGGALRHNHDVRFPVTLDEDAAARLLSAVRIVAGLAGSRDTGHSSAIGMTWHDGGELESLRVTARREGDATGVSIVLDRRGTLAIVGLLSGMAMILAVLFAGFALYPEAPALGIGGLIAGIGGVLAVARSYWASSTRKIQERIGTVIDAIGETLTQAETRAPNSKEGRDGAAAAEPEGAIEGSLHGQELLARGREILDPLLSRHGFAFQPGDVGVGSGGPFARGAYVRGSHRLDFSVRWNLGEVVYSVGPTRISHEELMRVVAGPRAARYPGFSNDPLDGFRGLHDDLEAHGKAFLREMDEDFHAFVAAAERSRPRAGFKRLSDAGAG